MKIMYESSIDYLITNLNPKYELKMIKTSKLEEF